MTEPNLQTNSTLATDLEALIAYAESEASTLAELARDDPGSGRQAAKALHTIMRVAPLVRSLPAMLEALRGAEAFISGFEEDEMQEGIEVLLQQLRAAAP